MFIRRCLLLLLPLMLIAQTERWVYRYNGPGNSADEGSKLTFGRDGNLYAVGHSTGSGTWQDFTVISLDTQSNQRWIYRYDGPASYYEYGTSIVSGENDNIYASGMRSLYMGYYEAIVVNLDTVGNVKWFRVDSMLITVAVTYGLDGNLYGSGYRTNIGTGDDVGVVSHDTLGNIRWFYQYPDDYSDWPYAIAYGPDGNIYVTGTDYKNSYSNSSFLVISLTPGGDQRWVYNYELPGTTGSDFDAGYSIAFGENSDVYFAGVSTDTTSGWDFTVISLDTSGNTRWVYRHNGQANRSDVSRSIVYGSDGNLYAAGYCSGTGSSYDLTIVSLDTAGNERWVYTYNGTGSSMDGAYAVVFGQNNNIYVTGYSTGVGSDFDFIIIGLDTLSSEKCVYRYNGPGNDRDEGNSIIYGQDGNLYATGFSNSGSSDDNRDFTIISIDARVGIGEDKQTRDLNAEWVRLTICPNPFSHTAEIRYSILARPASHGEDGEARYSAENPALKIYNTAGRLVRSFYGVSGIEHQGSSVVWDGTDDSGKSLPNGVYFVRAVTQDRACTGKVILLK